MEFIFIIAAIIISVVNANNKKKKQAEAAKRQASARSPEAEKARADERLRDYQAQRRQRETRPSVAPTVQAAKPQTAAPEATWRCACGAANRTGARFCTECGKPRYGGSMDYVSSEGKTASAEGATVPVMKPASAEGAAVPVMKPARPEGSPRPAAPTVRHVVKPMTESAHSHVESSMTGVEDCYNAPEEETHAADAYAIGGEERGLAYGLAFNRNAAVQGLLYAEILGKPKGLQRRGA